MKARFSKQDDLSHLRLQIEKTEFFLLSDFGLVEPAGPGFVRDVPAEQWPEHGAPFARVLDIGDLVGGAVTMKSN